MKKKVRGFTLIELIVVLAIIAVLSSVIIPNVIQQIRQQKIDTANTYAHQIYDATTDYMVSLQKRGYTKDEICTLFGATAGSDKVVAGFNVGDTSVPYVHGEGTIGGTTNFGSSNVKADAYTGILKALGNTSVTSGNAAGFWTQGSWIVIINTNTYSVESAYYCNEKSGPDSRVFATAANAFGSYDAQSREANTNATGRAYVGQYPIPIL